MLKAIVYVVLESANSYRETLVYIFLMRLSLTRYWLIGLMARTTSATGRDTNSYKDLYI